MKYYNTSIHLMMNILNPTNVVSFSPLHFLVAFLQQFVHTVQLRLLVTAVAVPVAVADKRNDSQ